MKKYIISSYIPNADIDSKFLNALSNYSRVTGAELLITECKYNYVNDVEEVYQLALLEELEDVLLIAGKRLNNNLKISGYKESINVIDPLMGLESLVAKEGSLIIPFPRHRFKVVPRNLTESLTPRAIWCTGTISEPSYKDTKSGLRMSQFHLKGALVVEILSDDIFNIRQIEWDGEGFYDLDVYYTSGKFKKVRDSISAISMGDDHAVFQDPNIMEKTVEFIRKYRIPHIFRHDTLDSASVSHHIEGKYLTKAMMKMTLAEELQLTANSFKEFEEEFPWAKQYAVASNHPEHLNRYLDEGRYREDYINHILALELVYNRALGFDPYEYSMKKFANGLPNTRFLSRTSSIKIAGIELANHGDEGPSGARASSKSLGITYSGLCVGAHTHSPEIGVYGNYTNGTSTYLSLPYTKDSGSSSWLNTHTLVYKNGKRTHLHFMPEA